MLSGVGFRLVSIVWMLESFISFNRGADIVYLKGKQQYMKRIVVFCGSGEGFNELYREAAYDLGSYLASRGMEVIYGGAKVGLMGALAEGALDNGGRVTGIIPSFLRTKEVAHEGLSELIIVDTMHERKLKMNKLSDAVITLPGGWGTMEEMFEMLTWSQLGLHKKPVGLLNVNGYYDALKVLCNNMVTEGFLDEAVNESLMISESPEELLIMMETYTPPPVPQWITERTS
jgi:uncharacterized protein (TIGR00730 family)